MNTILQVEKNDLQEIIRECVRQAIIEARPTLPEQSERIGMAEAMKMTGLKESAIYKRTMKGEIPFQKFGKRLVFSRKQLNEWIESRTKSKHSPDYIMTENLAKSAQKRMLK